jgi:hypothetical protein
MGKGLMNIGRGTLMGNPNIPQKVIVTNLPGAGGGLNGGDLDVGGEGKKGKGGKGGGRGGGGRGAKIVGGMKGPAILAVAQAGYQAYDTYENAETQDEKAEGYGKAAGGLAGTLAGAAAGAAIGTAVPIIGNIVGGLIGGYLGYMGGDALGGFAGKEMFGTPDSLKKVPDVGPLMMVNAGQNIPPVMGDIARSFAPVPVVKDMVQPQPKMLPLLTGAALVPQAAHDSTQPTQVLPPLVPAPPVSKPLLPERESAATALGDVTRALSQPVSPAVPAMLAPPAAAKPQSTKVEQRFDIQAPLHVTVQGDVKDPAQLARELQPYIDQQWRQSTQQLQNRSLFDEPHV